jgi:hypothetical protein
MKAQHSSFHSCERLYRQAGWCGANGREAQFGKFDRGKTVVATRLIFRMWMKKHGG